MKRKKYYNTRNRPLSEDAFVLVLSGRDLRQGLTQFVIECGLECRIQRGKHFVRGGGAGGLPGSVPRHAVKANEAGFMRPSDGANRVINRGMHERKAAGGVDGCRLRARCANNRQKYFVPLQDRVEAGGCGAVGGAAPILSRRR